MTQYIYMMVGAAGAGKSTYIKNHFPDAFDVSRDVARFDTMAKYNTDDYFAHEKEAFDTYINRINIPKDTKLYAIVIRPTLEQHIKQNANRTGKAFVPVDAIVKQYNSYIEPTCEEGFDNVIIL